MVLVFHPRLVQSTTWKATVTPLASIIGSGFLVLGPILKHEYEAWGIAVMAALCGMAYLLGNAIRFNILCHDQLQQESRELPLWVERLENASSFALTGAYVVSITYYLNLFGAFTVRLTSLNDPVHARIVSSAVLIFLVQFGWMRGFSALEKLEEMAVGTKLSIILGLLAGLFAYFFEQMQVGELHFTNERPFHWESLAVALGLVITVQGFETSRYLGNEFDAKTRIQTMKYSQWISTAIYIVYIALVTWCFSDAQVPDSETGIVAMTEVVAPVLPAMLVTAALAAQFSAAVADTGGCGGLAEEVSRKKISPRVAYLIIGVLGLALTWGADIYSIISYASRAFAVYYAFQCAVATLFAVKQPTPHIWRISLYTLLTIFSSLVVILGRPAE